MPPNALSTASTSIPAKKLQLATERCLRRSTSKPKAPLKSAAAKAGKEFKGKTHSRPHALFAIRSARLELRSPACATTTAKGTGESTQAQKTRARPVRE